MGVNEGKGTLSKAGKAHKRKELWQQVKRHRVLYLFALPCVIWLLVFCYAPMAGIVLAFKNYRFDLGIFGSEWAGLKHFQKFITSPEFWTTIRNTLVISGLKILICFPAPIIPVSYTHRDVYKRQLCDAAVPDILPAVPGYELSRPGAVSL